MSTNEPKDQMMPESFVHMLYEYFENKNLDAEPVLGMRRPHYPSKEGKAFPIREWTTLVNKAQNYFADECFGLHLGQTVALHHVGVLGYLMYASPTIAALLQLLIKYQRLLYDGNDMKIRGSGPIEVAWAFEGIKPDRISTEIAITAVVQFARDLTAERLSPVRIEFNHSRPSDISPYEEYFGCPVLFARPETVICADPHALTRPVRSADSTTLNLMQLRADAVLDKYIFDDKPFLNKVRKLISHELHCQEPNVNSVSEALHCSSRTLQRRLKESDTSFRSELELVRKKMAEDYLLESELSVSDIARLLGYAEHSGFTRSFKQWYGQSPLEFRVARAVRE